MPSGKGHAKSYKLYSPLPELPLHKTWAEIDPEALRANFRALRRVVPAGKRLISVVKADAYGHGADACVAALLEEGCDFFAVSCIDEALPVRRVIREAGKNADVLILGYTLPEQAATLAEHDVIQTVFSPEYAEAMAHAARAAGVCLRVHIKLDTGMNRIGFAAQTDAEIRQTAEDILHVATLEGIAPEGLFTHFACADEEFDTRTGAICDDGLTARQYERFLAVDDLLRAGGLAIPFRHVCNSAAAVRFPQYALEGVRLGILQYGVNPSLAVRFPLRPVMKLCTVVSHLHQLDPGEGVSYGACFKADAPRQLATLPIGYADGFLRAYSGAMVVIETASGKATAPIVGRICMDQCMVDVTGLHVRVGDRVVLFGDHPSELEELAARAGTIPYECLCLVSARVPRIYL